jgi:aminotransferase
VGSDAHLDEEKLKDAMEQKPRLIVLNTPNNPVGKVLDSPTLRLISDLCEEFDVIAVVDEIYEHITYEGKKHVSLASVGNMHNRTVTVTGASKTYSVTGWRVGWAIAQEELSNAIRKIHDYLTIGAPTPFQEALVTALNFPSSYYERLAAMYDEKRKRMMQILDDAEIQYYRPEGAYYILADAPQEFEDGEEFTNHLIRNVGVAVLPAIALYNDKLLGKRKVRLAYCKKEETLREVEKRIKKLKPELRQR